MTSEDLNIRTKYHDQIIYQSTHYDQAVDTFATITVHITKDLYIFIKLTIWIIYFTQRDLQKLGI